MHRARQSWMGHPTPPNLSAVPRYTLAVHTDKDEKRYDDLAEEEKQQQVSSYFHFYYFFSNKISALIHLGFYLKFYLIHLYI